MDVFYTEYAQIKNEAWTMVTRSMNMRHGHSIKSTGSKDSFLLLALSIFRLAQTTVNVPFKVL